MNIIPDAKDLALQGLIIGSKAHGIAKRQAEMGVEPNLASQYGQKLANCWYLMFWTLFVTVPMAVLSLGYGGLVAVWGAVHLAVLWVLWRRYKSYRDTDPRMRLRYGISTPKIMTFLVIWFVLVFPLGVIIPFWNSVGDPPKPRVVQIEVPSTTPVTASNPYGEDI